MNKLLKITLILAIMFSVFFMYNKVQASTLDSTQMYLDEPTNMQNTTKNLNVIGWVMSKENIEIKAYINDIYIRDLKRNDRRMDVIKAINGYGGILKNPYPGFNYTLDISNFKSGTYKLRIEVINANSKNKITELETYFTKSPSKTTGYIDSLYNFPTITDNKLPIDGWVMSETNVKIKLYIDGQYIQDLNRNKEREDVLKAIYGYGTKKENPLPGFNKAIDISNLQDGMHTIKIEVLQEDSNEIIYEQNEYFIKDELQMYLDSPYGTGDIITNNLNISGWVMTEKNIKINAYINNQFIKQLDRNETREDVIKAIKGYGGKEKNPYPGFNYNINVSDYKIGTYTLKIEVIDINTSKKIDEISRNFRISAPKTTGYIDNPYNGKVVSGKEITLEGWAMSETDIKIKIYINNSFIKEISRNIERQDVLNAIKGYGTKEQNSKPGFKTNLDISSYKDGNYNIKLEIISNNKNEVLQTLTTNIKLKNTKDIKSGIDVSLYQGKIDWQKVKSSGIDFAFIRVGYRGYGVSSDGTDGKLIKDSRYVENVQGALNAGIDVGVYFVTQAINEQEAIQEANFVLNLVKGYNITYPIVVDTETSSHPTGNGRADNLSVEQRTQNIKTFCETIERAGYTPMIYANKWWLDGNLDMNSLSKYQVWLAHYTGAKPDNPYEKPSDYKGKYSIWQYTDKGIIDGIEGYVDMNITH